MRLPHPSSQAGMIERAARVAAGRAGRLRPIIGYTRDDALQDARIGAWKALCSGADENTLALAGYRDILDARHARWSTSRGGDFEQPLPEPGDPEEPRHPCSGFGLVAASQMLRAIEKLAPPRPRVAAMLIEGYTTHEVAAEHGVSDSRVSQWRADIWCALAGCA